MHKAYMSDHDSADDSQHCPAKRRQVIHSPCELAVEVMVLHEALTVEGRLRVGGQNLHGIDNVAATQQLVHPAVYHLRSMSFVARTLSYISQCMTAAEP